MPEREQTSFLSHIGPVSLNFGQGVGEIGLAVELRHTNITGRVHGGLLMTLADSLLGRTGLLACNLERTATLSLSVDFLGPAVIGDRIRGRARLLRRAGEVLALQGELSVEGRTILTANGLWKALRPGKDAKASPSDAPSKLPQGYEEMDLLDPFERLVGPFYVHREDAPSYALLARPHHRNPFGRTHGGLLMTFADAALGDHVGRLIAGWNFVTVSQVTNFLGSVPAGAVMEVTPALISRTDSLLATEGRFHIRGEIVMTARSLWKLVRTTPSS